MEGGWCGHGVEQFECVGWRAQGATSRSGSARSCARNIILGIARHASTPDFPAQEPAFILYGCAAENTTSCLWISGLRHERDSFLQAGNAHDRSARAVGSDS